MELTELSLASSTAAAMNTVMEKSEYNNINSKKRKLFSDHYTSVDLHVKDPLPLDWEQCLDLQSGKMYYLNRKTLRKCWNWPKDQKLDLELNISSLTDCPKDHNQSNSILSEDAKSKISSPSSNMVALVCFNCHLLVILSKTSPSCPNCKYVHSLPISSNQDPLSKISTTKSLNTLSLLN